MYLQSMPLEQVLATEAMNQPTCCSFVGIDSDRGMYGKHLNLHMEPLSLLRALDSIVSENVSLHYLVPLSLYIDTYSFS